MNAKIQIQFETLKVQLLLFIYYFIDIENKMMEKVEVQDSGSFDQDREMENCQRKQVSKRQLSHSKLQIVLIVLLTILSVTSIIKLLTIINRLNEVQMELYTSQQHLSAAEQLVKNKNQQINQTIIEVKSINQKAEQLALKLLNTQQNIQKMQNNNIIQISKIQQQTQAKFKKEIMELDGKNNKLKSQIQKYEEQNKQLKQQLLDNGKKIVNLEDIIQRINKTSEIGSSSNKKQELPFNKEFTESPHQLKFHPKFKWYNRNHAHYLLKSNVSSVLQINCTNICKDNYKNDQDHKLLNVTFYDTNNIKQLSNDQIYDWVIVRYNATNKKQMFLFTQRFTKNAKKGVTLIFNNLIEYRQFKSYYQDIIEELMEFHSFQYDQMISLNLRRRQGKVLLVYSNQVKKSTFPFKKPAKNQIAIQFQIKLNENIPYMRQWIGYHIYMGVDKFFLYDNNGSLGEINKSNTTTNKYGLDFNCINYTDQQIIDEWDEIWEQFYEHIIYVPWQYLDSKGEITYAQMEGMADYINNFEDTTAYVGFIDLDQILFSQNHFNFPDFLTQKSIQGFTRIRLRQKKFLTRFCAPNMRVLDINYTFQVNTVGWAQKLFFQTQQFYPYKSPHTGKTFTGKQFIVNNDKDWRFNHYNLIERMIGYSHKVRNSSSTKLSYDNSGRQYKEVMDKICHGKCSQNFAVSCKLNNPLFTCPIDGKVYPVPPKVDPKKDTKKQSVKQAVKTKEKEKGNIPLNNMKK